MKIFFGINTTEDKTNTHYDGEVFQTRTISAEQEKRIQSLNEKAQNSAKSSSLPVWLSLLKSLSSTVGIVALVIIVKNAIDTSLSAVFSDMPIMFVIAAVCGAVYFGLMYAEYKKSRSEKSTAAAEDLEKSMLEVEAASLAELGVPSDAKEADVYASSYHIDGEKLIQGSRFYTFVTLVYRVFTENGCLCFANMRHRLDIPLKYIKTLKRFEGDITVPKWTKEEPIDSEKYSGFGITQEKTGAYKLKGYCGFIIKKDGTDYVLNFAPYEAEYIRSLIKK